MSETDHSCQAGPASLLDTLHSWDTHLASTTAGYSTRLYAGFYAISVLASLWVYFVARRLPPGALRGLACLPVVLLQLAATPLLVDRHRTAVLIVPVCGIFSLSAFKVIAFAMGRGPLAMSHCTWTQNLLQFGVVLSTPVIPRDAFKLGAGALVTNLGSQPPATWPTFLKLYGQKAAGAAAAASLAIWPVLPELVRHWFYALCLSMTLGALWDFWCCMAVAFAGIPVAPSFDKPWLSTSFADYWSRRWNLTTSYLLRVMVYEPVREGRFVPAAAVKTQRAPAASAAPTFTAAAAAAPAGPEDDESDMDQQPPRLHISDFSKPQQTTGPIDAAAVVEDTNTEAGTDTDLKAGPMGKDSKALTRLSLDVTADSSSSSHSCQEPDSLDSSSSTGMAPGISTPVKRPAAAAAAVPAATAVRTSPAAAGLQDPTAAAAAAAGARRKETRTQAMLRRVAATNATFLVSGLWHMLIFYYATGLVTYHWLAFFTVQGPIMVVEAACKHYAKQAGFKLPYPVSVFLANFLLIVVARPLFFGPCDWSGMCSAMLSNVKGSTA